MSSTNTPPRNQQQQPAGQQSGTRAISSPAAQGLPPTGLQQQLVSLRRGYQAARTASIPGLGGVGVDVNAGAGGRQQELGGGRTAMQAGLDGDPNRPAGSTSLNELARRLATSYDLAIGRDQLVDDQGNFMVTPDQLVAASGGQETLGTAATKMNYIASAIQRQQTEQSTRKAEAALQAGLGLASQRRAGSMIETQQQFYSGLANLYANQDFEAADFSYFIQKEKMDIEMEMLRKAEKLQKKKARTGFFGGLATGVLGILTGNVALGAQGFSTAVGNSAETGWF